MAESANVPLSRAEIIELLGGFGERIATAIRSEPSPAEVGAKIGEELVAANMAEPDSLSGTLLLLGGELLPAYELANDEDNRKRLNELCAKLSAGFMAAARERIFNDQETIKTAVVRAREDSEQARVSAESRFHTVFNTTTMGIAICNLEGKILRANPALGTILGYPDHALRLKTVQELVREDDWPGLQHLMRELAEGRRDEFSEYPTLVHANGEPIWSHMSFSLVREADGTPNYPVAMIEDISDLHLLQGQLRQQATADQLTGLANADKLRSQLDQVLATSMPGDLVALSYWDLDGFRVINDGLGRRAGDEMLQIVANKLREIFEPRDGLVARLAGDGFAVLLGHAPDKHAMSELVQEALDLLAEPHYLNGTNTGIAAMASVGIVVEPAATADADEMISGAEISLHRAKTSGKGRWELSEEELDTKEKNRCRLGAVLPGALETGEFVVRYQPAFWLTDRTLASVHAKAYWQHPEYGMITPPDFMPLAEETGMVVPIGRWVLNEICEQAATWLTHYGEAAPRVSLRLAGRMMRDPDLVRDINQLLGRHALPAERIQLGVLASALMDSDAVDSLIALSENGVAMGVDGVGAGGLSLTRLRDLPLRDVSMNPALVDAVTSLGDQESSPFERGLTCLIGIAHDLDCTVTVGDLLENDKVERLQKFGVDIGYGRALGPLCEPAGIDELLRHPPNGR
jgi:diguanylate cyclase (GGDEF)-like protein/PAS domain S-box-containing protein